MTLSDYQDCDTCEEKDVTMEMSSESYGMDELDDDTFPLSFITIDEYQRNDSLL